MANLDTIQALIDAENLHRMFEASHSASNHSTRAISQLSTFNHSHISLQFHSGTQRVPRQSNPHNRLAYPDPLYLVRETLPVAREAEMCICKPKRATGACSPASRKPLIDKDMTPPATPSPGARTIRMTDDMKELTTSASKTPALSLGQLSNILDPFFDSCTAARERKLRQRRQRRTLCRTKNLQQTATARRSIEEPSKSPSLGNALLSAVAVEGGSASLDGRHQTTSGALRDFLAMDNTAWKDMVQEMEDEKRDTVRLRVSVA